MYYYKIICNSGGASYVNVFSHERQLNHYDFWNLLHAAYHKLYPHKEQISSINSVDVLINCLLEADFLFVRLSEVFTVNLSENPEEAWDSLYKNFEENISL